MSIMGIESNVRSLPLIGRPFRSRCDQHAAKLPAPGFSYDVRLFQTERVPLDHDPRTGKGLSTAMHVIDGKSIELRLGRRRNHRAFAERQRGSFDPPDARVVVYSSKRDFEIQQILLGGQIERAVEQSKETGCRG